MVDWCSHCNSTRAVLSCSVTKPSFLNSSDTPWLRAARDDPPASIDLRPTVHWRLIPAVLSILLRLKTRDLTLPPPVYLCVIQAPCFRRISLPFRSDICLLMFSIISCLIISRRILIYNLIGLLPINNDFFLNNYRFLSGDLLDMSNFDVRVFCEII